MQPAEPPAAALARTSHDALFVGALPLEQPAKGCGYRFTVDALLLVRASLLSLQESPCDEMLELGAGVGVVALSLLRHHQIQRAKLIERDPWMASLAERNAALFPGRVTVVNADVCHARTPPAGTSFLVSNPPYFSEARGPSAPEPHRRAARAGDLRAFFAFARRALAPEGRSLWVLPVTDLVDALAHMKQEELFVRQLRWVHPAPERPARLALLLATRAPGACQMLEPWFERDSRGNTEASLLRFLSGGELPPD